MKWNDLTFQVQEDLAAWYNITGEILDLPAEDRRRLAKLFSDGRFHAWDCPQCGERVYQGEPDDWGHFQGVRQVDYASYPGDTTVYQEGYNFRRCDSCRCTCPPDISDRYEY